jgi:hypothetical protein
MLHKGWRSSGSCVVAKEQDVSQEINIWRFHPIPWWALRRSLEFLILTWVSPWFFFGQPKICPSNAGENGDCFLSRWPRPFFNEVPQELLGEPRLWWWRLGDLKRWQRADHVDGCVWKGAIGLPVYPQKIAQFSDRPPSVIWWIENCCHWAVWGIGVSCLKHLDQT